MHYTLVFREKDSEGKWTAGSDNLGEFTKIILAKAKGEEDTRKMNTIMFSSDHPFNPAVSMSTMTIGLISEKSEMNKTNDTRSGLNIIINADFIPIGEDMDEVSSKYAKTIEKWCNVLGYYVRSMVFGHTKYLNNNNMTWLSTIKKFINSQRSLLSLMFQKTNAGGEGEEEEEGAIVDDDAMIIDTEEDAVAEKPKKKRAKAKSRRNDHLSAYSLAFKVKAREVLTASDQIYKTILTSLNQTAHAGTYITCKIAEPSIRNKTGNYIIFSVFGLTLEQTEEVKNVVVAHLEMKEEFKGNNVLYPVGCYVFGKEPNAKEVWEEYLKGRAKDSANSKEKLKADREAAMKIAAAVKKEFKKTLLEQLNIVDDGLKEKNIKIAFSENSLEIVVQSNKMSTDQLLESARAIIYEREGVHAFQGFAVTGQVVALEVAAEKEVVDKSRDYTEDYKTINDKMDEEEKQHIPVPVMDRMLFALDAKAKLYTAETDEQFVEEFKEIVIEGFKPSKTKNVDKKMAVVLIVDLPPNMTNENVLKVMDSLNSMLKVNTATSIVTSVQYWVNEVRIQKKDLTGRVSTRKKKTVEAVDEDNNNNNNNNSNDDTIPEIGLISRDVTDDAIDVEAENDDSAEVIKPIKTEKDREEEDFVSRALLGSVSPIIVDDDDDDDAAAAEEDEEDVFESFSKKAKKGKKKRSTKKQRIEESEDI